MPKGIIPGPILAWDTWLEGNTSTSPEKSSGLSTMIETMITAGKSIIL